MNEHKKPHIEDLARQVSGLKVAFAELSQHHLELWEIVNGMLGREKEMRDVLIDVCKDLEKRGRSSGRLHRLVHDHIVVEERVDNLEMKVFLKLPGALRELRDIVGDAASVDTDNFDRRTKKH